MAKRNLKARYRTVGPKREKVSYTRYHIDDNGSLQGEPVTEEKDCWYVFFPHGHSIRVTSYDRLKELGYHVKPRIVDMDTGDLIDIGGDPYDFGEDYKPDENIVLEDGDLSDLAVEPKSAKRRTADANA